MKHTLWYTKTRGEYGNMAHYELDRLFGQALTDDRFFRLLCQQPSLAVNQFELDESETQAVLSIAPQVATVQELAAQLDVWMTARTMEPSRVRIELRPVSGPHGLSFSDHIDLDMPQAEHRHTYPTIQTRTRQNEQATCLRMSEYVSQS